MNKKFIAAQIALCNSLLVFTCPIHANDVTPITHKRQETMMSIVDENFSQDLSDLEYIKTDENVHYFENNIYSVKVNEKEDQTYSATIYVKSISPFLAKLGFPAYSLGSIEFDETVFDTQAPVIEVEDEIVTELAQEINFDEMISVTDNVDTKLSYTIDTEVDYSKEGSYPCIISCTDTAGNETKKEITIKVKDEAFYQRIADAALAQLGVYQDCTMLVTNSLKAVGINFHGAPYAYSTLGEWTDNPVPGDICIYQGHVALYIGNGQAVHGGWLGNQTVISTVACTNPFIGYIHVNH